MRYKPIILATAILLSGAVLSQSLNKELATELLSMQQVDQDLRGQMGDAIRDGVDPGYINSQVAALDSLHNEALHRIISQYGHPTKQLVGIDGAHAFWLLVMHQDHDLALQRQVLEGMTVAHEAGEVIDRDVAFLSDRVAVNEGRCQTYGTQVDFDVAERKYVSFPICSLKKMKRARKKMRLKPYDMQMKEENAGL